MDTIAIRPANAADLGRMTAIYAEAVINGTSSYELEPPSLDAMTTRFTALCDAGFPYLVATSESQVLGYAYAGPFRPRPAYRFMVEDSIYIAHEARGRGVGRALLKRLIGDAATLGFRQMVAVIGDGPPQSPSVRIHESLGFRHSGIIVGSGFKHGRWLDTVFMQLAMNGGTASLPDPGALSGRLQK